MMRTDRNIRDGLRVIGRRLDRTPAGTLRASLVITASVLVAVLACTPSDGSNRQAASRDLPVAQPEEHGVDGAALRALADQVRDGTYGSTHALLVVRNGHVVFEEYFRGWSEGRLHEMQSISKGVVSLAVGVALEQGALESLDQRIVDYFPDLEIRNRNEWKEAITIGDILRMSTGTAYEEGFAGSPHSRLNRMRRGWTEFWLGQKMAFEPSTGWHYDSGGVIALSAVFQRTTGMHVDDFAREHIFEPLGIERYEWERNDEGHPHAGGGLHLRARDLAKIGLLMLNGGEWKGRQIVSADWVERSTRTKFRFAAEAHPFQGYAYLWWVFAPDPAVPDGSRIVAGTGLGGQYVFWIPDHDMVVVVLGWSDDPDESQAPIRFLYEHILPALR